jgi:hypothetical protein
MVSSHFVRRKPTAYDRTCLGQGKILVKDEETKRIYCRKKTHYSRDLKKKARELLKSSTVQRLKSFLALKGFYRYSKFRKPELINLILEYTDWTTGEIIYRSKLVESDEIKSLPNKRSKSSHHRRSKNAKR